MSGVGRGVDVNAIDFLLHVKRVPHVQRSMFVTVRIHADGVEHCVVSYSVARLDRIPLLPVVLQIVC